MQILSAEQMREWDAFTIAHEPVSSIDLMERAAQSCYQWILSKGWITKRFLIFCGVGNNGGDGLAMARMLDDAGSKVSVYLLHSARKTSADFDLNLKRLGNRSTVTINSIEGKEDFPFIDADIVVDALFGSGLNKPLDSTAAALVEHINSSAAAIVSIDVPSGLYMDRSSLGNTVIRADHTLSFQSYKLGLLVQENGPYLGQVSILDIGLSEGFLHRRSFDQMIVPELARQILRPRNRFSHKGDFGHALLIAGSRGKMGAVILAAKAGLRSGCGLLTCCIPGCGEVIMQTAVPEAMVVADKNMDHIQELPEEVERYAAVGIGPGLGRSDDTRRLVSFITRRYHQPLVLDADALNALADQQNLLPHLPKGSILTPHPREFDRLFGEHSNDFARIVTAKENAMEHGLVILLKGHHTLIAMPSGTVYFNTTGNAGMAKGGSGDALTGILTSLLAQGYSPNDAAILGVFLHGLAADLALSHFTEESLLASDLVAFLPSAFRQTGV